MPSFAARFNASESRLLLMTTAGVAAMRPLRQALMMACMLLPRPVSGWWEGVLPFLLPLHVLVHLKGAYGLSWAGAVVRSMALGTLTLMAFGLLMIGLSAVAWRIDRRYVRQPPGAP